MTRRLKGRYEILETVARGGEGEVVRALDHLHDRQVALKLREARSAATRAALTAEARVLFAVRPHARVTLLREDFLTSSRYCMVMDWVPGRTLAVVLAEEGRPGLELDAVLAYMTQAAEALDHLHAHDPPVVHRDVKPANLIETPAGQVVLVDFGIASAPTRSGTLSYAAPEVVSGGEVTPRSDVYSLAVTAYVLLTGALPVLGIPPAWQGLGRNDARRVQRGLARALAIDPARRPTSASAFVELLRPKPRPSPKPGPHNLPAPLTSFVGRRRELAEVLRQLRASRVVTLTGTGGVGKTRLALEASTSLAQSTPGGVWLVELASLTGGVSGAVASTLGLREEPGRSLTDTIAGEIARKDVVLVLDNCEHVVDECAAVLAELLRSCPRLRALATSRGPLAISGEAICRVPSLQVPDEGLPPRRTAASEAVRLFAERAAAANPNFTLDDPNEAAAICRALDGIPLAIELAAARAGMLSVKEILERLGEALRLAAPRDAPARHRSLQAAMDWGHELLTERERTVLRRSAVFRGGCTLEAAEEVCTGGSIAREDVLGLLTGLVNTSFVGAEQSRGRTRYVMLQTMQSYAAEKLKASGEEAGARARHEAWARALAERAEPELVGADETEWLDRLDAERDNLRAAAAGTSESAAPTAAALGRYWLARGMFSEGRSLLEAALSGGVPAALEAKILNAAGGLALSQGDHAAARSLFERSLGRRRELGDASGTAASLNNLGIIARESGDHAAAQAFMEESLSIQRDLGDVRGVAAALHNLALVALAQDHYSAARSLLEENLAVQRDAGDRHGAAWTLINLGIVAWTQGDDDAARAVLEESLAVNRELGDEPSAAACLHNLALVARDQCRAEDARALFEQALAIHREIGDERAAARSLCGLGMVCIDTRDLEGARARLEEALAAQEALSDTDGRSESLAGLGIVAVHRGDLDSARTLVERSLSMRTTPRAVAECLEWLARAEPHGERTVVLLGAANALRESIGATVSALDSPALMETTRSAREALGATFESAWERGRLLAAEWRAAGRSLGAGAETGQHLLHILGVAEDSLVGRRQEGV